MAIIREKTVKSGSLLEIEFFPVWGKNGSALPTQPGGKRRRSKEEQDKLNAKNANKKFVRLVNANFSEGDDFITITYNPKTAPTSDEQCYSDLHNFQRKIQRRRKKELAWVNSALEKMPLDKKLLTKKAKLEEPLRRIAVLEGTVYQKGVYKGLPKRHIHLFMNTGLEPEVIEECWNLGDIVKVDRYQPNRFGLETAARYLCKEPQGSKRFSCSKNLRRPEERKQDGRFSKRTVEKMGKERVDDREFWEKKYKGYRFVRCISRYNEYNGFWYVSAVMYRDTSKGEDLSGFADFADEIIW